MQKSATIARRQLLAAAGTGLLILQSRMPARAQEKQAKLSKPESEYQDSPKNDQQCSECTKFQPPKRCSVVAGDISPRGWCKLYEAAPE